MKNILVYLSKTDLKEEHMKKLSEACDGFNCEFVFDKDALEEKLPEANILIGNVPPKMLKNAEKLEFVQLYSAGYDAYVVPGILSESTAIASANGAYNRAVAEHGFALLWTILRNIHLYRDKQLRHEWNREGYCRTINGSTVVVMGLGNIGGFFAKLCKNCGAYVIGVKKHLSAPPEGVDEVHTIEEINDILPRADIVFSVFPGTEETEKFYNEEKFGLMKESAIFINCGRGSAVDEKALQNAMISRKLFAAALDVNETEPLPKDSPLWDIPNLVITPHVAGNYSIPEIMDNIIDISIENIKNYVDKKPYRNLVKR